MVWMFRPWSESRPTSAVATMATATTTSRSVNPGLRLALELTVALEDLAAASDRVDAHGGGVSGVVGEVDDAPVRVSLRIEASRGGPVGELPAARDEGVGDAHLGRNRLAPGEDLGVLDELAARRVELGDPVLLLVEIE